MEELKKRPDNVEFEKISIAVASAASENTFSQTTEVDHDCIIGVALVLSDSDALPNSLLELKIDGKEVFPSGFEAHMIYCGTDVPPDERFFTFLNRPVKQVKVEGKFTDGDALSSFAAYTANVYLLCTTTKRFE